MPAKKRKSNVALPDLGAAVVLKRQLTNACGHTFDRGAAMVVDDYEADCLLLRPAATADRKLNQNYLAVNPDDIEEVCA